MHTRTRGRHRAQGPARGGSARRAGVAAALAMTMLGGGAGVAAAQTVGAASPAARAAVAAATPASTPTTFVTLRTGMKGARVATLQSSLAGRGYWLPTARGTYGHSTQQAVMALQKTAGLPRTGVYDAKTAAALAKGVVPKARSTSGRVIEIDRKRQLLLVVRSGKVTSIVNTSTGRVPKMTTPAGTFRVTRRIDGWRQAPLGGLYRPMYFYRGYAVHGVRDGNIPGHPASHGCARVSMAAMDMLWSSGAMKIGDPVRVY